MVELCPTIEEFSDILGCEPRVAPIVPSCNQRHRVTISKVLGLPLDAIPPFIQCCCDDFLLVINGIG